MHEQFDTQTLMSDARMEEERAWMRRRAAETALAASTLELVTSQNTSSESLLLEPRPLLSLDHCQLHTGGMVEIQLSDNRHINIMTRSFGPEDGYPIMFCPGLPASGMPDLPYQRTRDLHNSGLRLLMWDRPAYGDSERWQGHRVGDGAVLMQAIARAYNITRLSVAGRSGGAPYALAAGALLPEVANVAIFACRAPANAEIDRLNGVETNNERLIGLADEETLAKSFEDTSGEAIVRNPSGVIRSIMPHLGPSDMRVVNEPQVHRYLAASHENALKHGSSGRIDNIMALRAHWCFELSDLGEKEVYIIQGTADDKYTSIAHFDYLREHIPHNIPIERSDMGHMGTIALEMPVFRALARSA
ncbi:MAG TPA: alpha/beta hydrolase [Candidatus Chromulinivoraceae bacterium]|nr:alpha/beta hydrolase [Candidatus Chromulinivoraceae bacterium]